MDNVPLNLKSGSGGDFPQEENMEREFMATSMAFMMTYLEKGMLYAERYATFAERDYITVQDIKIGLRYAMFDDWDENIDTETSQKMRGHYEKMKDELKSLQNDDVNEDEDEEKGQDQQITGIISQDDIPANEEQPFTFAKEDKDGFVKLAHYRVVVWERYEPEDRYLQLIKKAVSTIGTN